MEFWSDLEGIELDETDPVWLQAMPFNKYSHPLHGTIEITPERAQRFADNFKANVVGTDLDIDYDHKKLRADAAGWIKDIAIRTGESDPKRNGLWYLVDFTKEARQKIKDKAYRYFSAEFQNSFTHPVTKKTFKDVVRGGGLTNRPHLKDILPINLSELTDEQPKEGTVDIEKLRKQLKLPETATEDEVLAAVTELQGKSEDDIKSEDDKKEGKDEKELATLSEAEKELVKLAESNPVIKLLLEERKQKDEETRTQLAELRESHLKSQLETKLSEVTKGGKFALPPSALESIKLSDDGTFSLDDVMTLLSEITKNGLVELGERGATHETESDAAKKLNEEIEKHQKENKSDYATALSEVTRGNPSLYDNYLNELTEV